MTHACQATIDRINQTFGVTPAPGFKPTELPGIGRRRLAAFFRELGFTRGAEIGVEQGVYSEELCKAIPGVKLLCVDAWKAYKGYRDHVSQEKLDGFYQLTQDRLKPYDCDIRRGFSMDVVKTIPNESLDFVYIDGNHNFQNVANDLAEWSKKVREGGIVSGHDYVIFRRSNNQVEVHVVQVLTGWTDAYEIQPWYIIGSKEIKDGVERDRPRSWMYVQGSSPAWKRR